VLLTTAPTPDELANLPWNLATAGVAGVEP
jgi:hypothetical protein